MDLSRLVMRLSDDNVRCVIVDNGSDVRIAEFFDLPHLVISDSVKPPELYRMWNVALDIIEQDARYRNLPAWNVGIFNDDANVPEHWWQTVEWHLRHWYITPEQLPAAVSTHPYHDITSPIVHIEPNRSIGMRMCPWAFMIRGELGMRADPDFKWWWGDTDFEWQLTREAGVMLVPGPLVVNERANSTTVGELAIQAGRDREHFIRKWGFTPW